MSDLTGGRPTGGNGRAQNGSSRAAPSSGPVPAAPQPPYPRQGVRTPTEIMRQREERNRRREQEAREQEEERIRAQERETAGVAEQLPRQRRADNGAARVPGTGGDDSYRRHDRQRSSAAGAASRAPPPGTQGSPAVGRAAPVDPGLATAPTATARQRAGSAAASGQPRQAQTEGQGRRTRSETYQQQPQSRGPPPAAQPGPSSAQAGPSNVPGSQAGAYQGGGTGGPARSTTSSFPHAFERWETLSSHWEGLTSYWIRRLEQNKDEVDREPLNSQLARQITDLSAAGANLFHAVVELQRLRASSERKFQRWFFETRNEQERAQEVQAALEKTLREERQARAELLANIGKADRTKADADQRVREMRRELQISKEEARRAWEELGRREQEERDRTTSLRNGEPTLVGGVQVVPMTMGVPSRQTSTNRPATGDEQQGPQRFGSPGNPLVGAQSRQDSGEPTGRRFSYEPESYSSAESDPFTEGATAGPPGQRSPPPSHSLHHEPDIQSFDTSPLHPRQQQQQPPASTPTRVPTYQPTTAASTHAPPEQQFYQQTQPPTLHEPAAPEPPRGVTSEPSSRSYVPSTLSSDLGEEEYEIDDNGTFRRDAQGRPIVYRRSSPEDDDGDSDEYDVQSELAREREYQRRYAGQTTDPGAPVGEGGLYASGGYGSEADYSGSSWGAGTGWEAVQRHRHPTRLSDVLEEDERSRVTGEN